MSSTSFAQYVHPADEAAISNAVSVHSLAFHKSIASTNGELVLDLNEDKPQLTLNAMVSGVISGVICSFLALYYGLKTGITPSLNILGGVVGFAVGKALLRTNYFGTHYTPQENAIVQTISVAVYSITIPAFGFASGYLGLSREAYEVVGPDMPGNKIEDTIDLAYWKGLVWALALFPFGFFIAYPLRNYYVYTKRLLFPSGTATAYVVNSLHASKTAAKTGLMVVLRWFSIAFLVNMTTWFFDGLAAFPLFGQLAANYGWVLDWDLGTAGIGMLLSLQVNGSMLLGALIIYAGLQPWIDNHRQGSFEGAWFDEEALKSPYLGLYAYALFAGLAIMIVQGVWGVIAILSTVVKANMDERKKRKRGEVLEEGPVDALQERKDAIFLAKGLPGWINILGYLAGGALCIIVLNFVFHTKWYQPLVAIVIVPLLAVSNIEGMGRTDWDVSSAYGKLMMFPIGAWNHGDSIIPSIAVCHTTISGCSMSALLMQDFKTGYLLGSNPTNMFYAQVFGSIVGCFVCPAILTLFRSVWSIPADLTKFPHAFIPGKYAPIFRTLAIVATGSGFDALPAHCVHIACFFIGLTVLLNATSVILQRYKPRLAPFVPEPSAMSIGVLVGATVPLEFLAGNIAMEYWKHRYPEEEEEKRNYIASGCVAGAGLAVVGQCLLSVVGVTPGISVAWASNADLTTYGAGRWITIVIALLVVAGVVWILGKTWWGPKEEEENLAMLEHDNTADKESSI